MFCSWKEIREKIIILLETLIQTQSTSIALIWKIIPTYQLISQVLYLLSYKHNEIIDITMAEGSLS